MLRKNKNSFNTLKFYKRIKLICQQLDRYGFEKYGMDFNLKILLKSYMIFTKCTNYNYIMNCDVDGSIAACKIMDIYDLLINDKIVNIKKTKP